MKIIFFINSLQQQRCYKRIREFIANGYDYEAYGFMREGTKIPITQGCNAETIGTIKNNMTYTERLIMMRNAMKPIISMHNNHDTLFYYFLLDVAMAGRSLTNHRYIYEESDISQAYIRNSFIRSVLDLIDQRIINDSLLTLFTSSGFFDYHNGRTKKNKIIVVPNKLDRKVADYTYRQKNIDFKHIKFGYVGHIRHHSTYDFALTIGKFFPQHEMRLYGSIRPEIEIEQLCKQYPNITYYGSFTNPNDLPQIYEDIDILIAPEYDILELNGKYAEPNKLYDSIYFRKPILTNPGTHTAKVIISKGIGQVIDFNIEDIHHFVQTISQEQIQHILKNLNSIPKEEAINDNPQLFNRLKEEINTSI